MAAVPERHLWRYLRACDRFVRVRALATGVVPVRPEPGWDARTYRRRLVLACVDLAEGESPEAAREADGEVALAALHPDGPEAAIDALYEQVVAVNPALELSRLSAPEDERAARTPRTSRPRGTPPSAPEDAEAARRRLAGRARGLRDRLSRRVLGQPSAVDALVRAFERAAAGLSEPRGPRAALLFLGRTGTGKTELARALAAELDPERTDARLLRIDCSELAEEHQISRLIGAPPGYVGHAEGGALFDALAASPDAVVLFDEVEKAHGALHDLLLQVLDEGRLTDGRGRVADFRRAFVLLTSNAGSDALAGAADGVGFAGRRALAHGEALAIARAALGRRFRPELLARLDDTLVFRDLDADDLGRIAARELGALAARARRRGLAVEVRPSVARWIAREALRSGEGARHALHAVRREVEGALAAELLARGRGGRVTVGLRRGRPRIERRAG